MNFEALGVEGKMKWYHVIDRDSHELFSSCLTYKEALEVAEELQSTRSFSNRVFRVVTETVGWKK